MVSYMKRSLPIFLTLLSLIVKYITMRVLIPSFSIPVTQSHSYGESKFHICVVNNVSIKRVSDVEINQRLVKYTYE